MKWNKLFDFAPIMAIFLLAFLPLKNVSDYQTTRKPSSSQTRSNPNHPKTETDSFITVTAVGDIMLGTNFPSPNLLPPVNNENLLLPAADLLKSKGLTFGNMEGSILNQGGTQKKCRDTNVCYLFRMPERLAGYLKSSGFDVLSLANNHSGDFGLEGRNNTMRVLDSLQIGYCGLVVKPYTIINKNNIKYGIISFAPNSGTLNINNPDSEKLWIQELRKKCDILLVSFHGGAEGTAHQHIVKEDEFFYGENRGNVIKFAHIAIDAGADMVIGQGPHVARAMEIYKGKLIAYSLGNFCTYKRFSLKGENSYAPLLRLNINRKGKFLNGRIYSFIQKGEGGPVRDPEKHVLMAIKNLTKSDIPSSGLIFNKDGTFVPSHK